MLEFNDAFKKVAVRKLRGIWECDTCLHCNIDKFTMEDWCDFPTIHLFNNDGETCIERMDIREVMTY